jgi:hypothetical protein
LELTQVLSPPTMWNESGAADGKNGNSPEVDYKMPAPSSHRGIGDTLSKDEAACANHALVQHMQHVLEYSLGTATELRQKLQWTYWTLITLSVLMFAVGLALVSTPLWTTFLPTGKAPDLSAVLTAVGVGLVDFVALFLYGPVDRIKKLMGDISQLTISFDTYQVQVAMQLLATDSAKRESLVEASTQIGNVAKTALSMIERFYEGPRGKQAANGVPETDLTQTAKLDKAP